MTETDPASNLKFDSFELIVIWCLELGAFPRFVPLPLLYVFWGWR